MKVVTQYMTNNPYVAKNQPMKVQGLMLHSVGCPQENPEVFYNNYNKSNFYAASVHGFIGADKFIITAPIFDIAGQSISLPHCGGSPNGTHIGIEMCEPSCIKYIGGATFTCSDVPRATAFVEKVTQNAVEIFARLCVFHGLNPLQDGVILSHYEGNQRGIASPHADPDHLWRQLGMNYNMNQFRQDVVNKMTELGKDNVIVKEEDEDMDVNRFGQLMSEYRKELQDNDCSNYSAEARAWAIKNKIIAGGTPLPSGEANYMWGDFLTREQMVTLLYRFAKYMGK